jgi:histidyl-tRNA synthetase
MNLGKIATSLDLTEEGFKIAIGHIKKTRAIYNLVGMKDDAKQIDNVISMLTAEDANDPNIKSSTTTSSMLQSMKIEYENSLTKFGMNSEATIQAG